MNADTAWTATLGELELQMTRATFNTWLKDARLLTNEDSEYVIGVRNDYARDWLDNRLKETINRTLSSILGEPVTTRFVVWSDEIISPAPPVLSQTLGQNLGQRRKNGERNNPESSLEAMDISTSDTNSEPSSLVRAIALPMQPLCP